MISPGLAVGLRYQLTTCGCERGGHGGEASREKEAGKTDRRKIKTNARPATPPPTTTTTQHQRTHRSRVIVDAIPVQRRLAALIPPRKTLAHPQGRIPLQLSRQQIIVNQVVAPPKVHPPAAILGGPPQPFWSLSLEADVVMHEPDLERGVDALDRVVRSAVRLEHVAQHSAREATMQDFSWGVHPRDPTQEHRASRLVESSPVAHARAEELGRSVCPAREFVDRGVALESVAPVVEPDGVRKVVEGDAGLDALALELVKDGVVAVVFVVRLVGWVEGVVEGNKRRSDLSPRSRLIARPDKQTKKNSPLHRRLVNLSAPRLDPRPLDRKPKRIAPKLFSEPNVFRVPLPRVRVALVHRKGALVASEPHRQPPKGKLARHKLGPVAEHGVARVLPHGDGDALVPDGVFWVLLRRGGGGFGRGGRGQGGRTLLGGVGGGGGRGGRGLGGRCHGRLGRGRGGDGEFVLSLCVGVEKERDR